MSKTHLLELSEEGFSDVAPRCSPPPWPPSEPGMLWRRCPGKLKPILGNKAAIVPRPEVPWLVESEEQPVMRVPVAEAMVLEIRRMAELEHNVPVAEPKHWTAVAEVTEVPRLERPGLSKEATAVEIAATVAQVQLRASVP